MDVILQSNQIKCQEFAIIEALAMSYPNDPMVRKITRLGNTSAKVLYLIDYERNELVYSRGATGSGRALFKA